MPFCLSTNLLIFKGDYVSSTLSHHSAPSDKTSLCSCIFLRFNPSMNPSLWVKFQTLSMAFMTPHDLSLQAYLHYFLYLKFEQDEGVLLSPGGSFLFFLQSTLSILLLCFSTSSFKVCIDFLLFPG